MLTQAWNISNIFLKEVIVSRKDGKRSHLEHFQKNGIKRNLKIRISHFWHTINQVIFIYKYIRQTVVLQVYFTNWGQKATLKKFSFRSVKIFPYLDVTFFQIGSTATVFSVM